MFLQQFSLLSWNVRGLGCLKKCEVVKNSIKNSRCDLVLLQETKCNIMDVGVAMQFLPSFFDYNVAFNLASNSSGGIVISWKRSFQLMMSWSTPHTLTVLLKQVGSGRLFFVTCVYGPTEDALQPMFIAELHTILAKIDNPWILAGDFNLARWITDRSSGCRRWSLIEQFNDFITAAQLIDSPLTSRLYTWSNKRPHPTFSKIDRVLLTSEWTSSYPIVTLQALEVLASDHAPLLLKCKGLPQLKKKRKMETFWFKYEIPKAMVQQLWSDLPSIDPATSFLSKTELLQGALHLWHSSAFGAMDKALEDCKSRILQLDILEETRPLLPHEFQLRIQLRVRAYDLACNVEERWKQRSHVKWLAQGDRNTRFFHAMASTRLRRNRVHSLQEEGITISDPVAIHQAFVKHMTEIIGVSSQVLPFDATVLYPTNPDLSALHRPFHLHEIEQAVKQLANNKSSGPDGIPNEFVKLYWDDLKAEIMEIFHHFHRNDLNMQNLNMANIIMIPVIF